jgi:hypothetical protein
LKTRMHSIMITTCSWCSRIRDRSKNPCKSENDEGGDAADEDDDVDDEVVRMFLQRSYLSRISILEPASTQKWILKTLIGPEEFERWKCN